MLPIKLFSTHMEQINNNKKKKNTSCSFYFSSFCCTRHSGIKLKTSSTICNKQSTPSIFKSLEKIDVLMKMNQATFVSENRPCSWKYLSVCVKTQKCSICRRGKYSAEVILPNDPSVTEETCKTCLVFVRTSLRETIITRQSSSTTSLSKVWKVLLNSIKSCQNKLEQHCVTPRDRMIKNISNRFHRIPLRANLNKSFQRVKV